MEKEIKKEKIRHIIQINIIIIELWFIMMLIMFILISNESVFN